MAQSTAGVDFIAAFVVN